MKVIKPFGPTIGITKLTKTTVTKLNRFSEKVVSNSGLTKKYDFDSQLIGSMKQQFRVPQKVLKSGIENVIKKSIKDYCGYLFSNYRDIPLARFQTLDYLAC